MLLAIDPGADMGWAIFSARSLVSCGVGESTLRAPFDDAGHMRVVCERPMIYPPPRQKAKPRDVITLALRAGEAAGLYARRFGVEPEYFEPDVWKGGSISKEVHHPRIWKRLSVEEKRVAEMAATGILKSKQHNMLDAIGIGLFALRRNA